jgi:peptidoglycan/xylan/chitin deacetylase (PgdA/CDA1 family)
VDSNTNMINRDIETMSGMKPEDNRFFLAVTVDTEEDEWGGFALNAFTLKNIQRVPRLQDLFDKYGMLPTYLVTYPVASDEESVKILRKIMEDGRCEIGTHPHPWNTPPAEEERNERNSFMNNLPFDLQFRKIRALHETIRRNFHVTPTSFRSGRWGFSEYVARNLSRLGYKVDSSLIPYTDWSEYKGPDYSSLSAKPRALFPGGTGDAPDENLLVEVPPSVGYLQRDQEGCNRVYYRILRSRLKHLSILGLLDRLKLLNRVNLSPEINNGRDMVELASRMMGNGFKVLNLFFHSCSLLENRSSIVRTRADAEAFLRRIEMVLAFARDRNIQPIKLSDAGSYIGNQFEETPHRKVSP